MTDNEIEGQKNIEYYAASVAAWYESSLEHDKSLLTLSAGGIGLLITLLTTVGLDTAEALVLYAGAIISFVVSIISVLGVFRENKRYIEDVLAGKNQTTDPILSKLDGTAIWSFAIGVVFTAVIGISAAIHSYTPKEITMANETKKTTETKESVNCAENARLETCSHNGAKKLQSQQQIQSNVQTTTSTNNTHNGNSQSQSNNGK